MLPREWQIGEVVTHPNRPDWGPGKIVRVEANRIHVVWRDLPDRAAKKIVPTAISLERAADQSDPVLDNLPPLVERKGELFLPAERVSFQQAVDRFLAKYPLGFEDPGYIGSKAIGGERHYKWDAHLFFLDRLGGGHFRELLESDADTLVLEVLRCIRKTNLPYPMEKTAIADALEDGHGRSEFLSRLADVLDAEEPTEQTYTAYVRALGNLPVFGARVACWPNATIIPFLADPTRHMFLKPEPTQKAADALGFHLNYKPEPNWLTYRRLLDMATIYMDKLSPYKPKDLIDVQSFFWLVSGDH